MVVCFGELTSYTSMFDESKWSSILIMFMFTLVWLRVAIPTHWLRTLLPQLSMALAWTFSSSLTRKINTSSSFQTFYLIIFFSSWFFLLWSNNTTLSSSWETPAENQLLMFQLVFLVYIYFFVYFNHFYISFFFFGATTYMSFPSLLYSIEH